jgi:molecular chaperone DnaK
LQGTDIAALRQATQTLNETMQKIGQAVYQQQQQQPPPPPPGAQPPPPGGEQPPKNEGEGTVEGEFREV